MSVYTKEQQTRTVTNKETGKNCLYFPNIAGDFDKLVKYCEFSRDIGVGGLMIMPALTGFDIVRYLLYL